MKRHVGYSHTKQYRLNLRPCEICGLQVVNSRLPDHMKKHVDITERLKSRVQCDICKKFLLSRTGLLKHMYIHSKSPANCPHCSRKFINRVGMLAHVRRTHREDRRLKCTICDFTVLSKYKFKVSRFI